MSFSWLALPSVIMFAFSEQALQEGVVCPHGLLPALRSCFFLAKLCKRKRVRREEESAQRSSVQGATELCRKAKEPWPVAAAESPGRLQVTVEC